MEEEKESDPSETGGDVNVKKAEASHVETVDVSVNVTEDVELDYEADEDEKDEEKLIQERKDRDDTNAEDTVTPGWGDKKEETTVGVDEELEEGEVSDEDEEARKERLKPQPVCRFYNKGQCTWGASCRFIHPGVLDTGRYSMFAQPTPILPGAEGKEEASPMKEVESGGGDPANPASTEAEFLPRPETAWERGLRQAKEMRKRSQQRKETDVEYEEKRTNMSLTQAELDKENDYFIRQASPIHDNEDEFADDMVDVVRHRDDYRQYESGRRRVAPPPPIDFEAPSPSLRRYPPLLREGGRGRYSPTPNPKGRPFPARSPPDYDDVESGAVPRRKDDDWADPWMRGGQRRRDASPSRASVGELSQSRTRPSLRRSYSSGSSRSSSSSSDMLRARGRLRRRGGRRRSSSASSKSSGSSPSRSRSRSRKSPRSSSPEDIPRRGRPFAGSPTKKKAVAKNEAPLQKRLGTVGSSSSNAASGLAKNIKKEPEDKPPRSSGGDKQRNSNMVPLGTRQAARRTRRSSSNSSRSSTKSPPRRKIKQDPSVSPPRKLTSLKSSSRIGSSSQSKVNRPAVLPVVSTMISPSKQNQSRSADSQVASVKSTSRGSAPAAKQIKLQIKSSIATKPANKTVLEKLGMSHDDMAHSAHKTSNPTEVRSDKRKDAIESLLASGISNKKDKLQRKEEKKSAADRREELLKQLKAVENAIAKKRTKISH